MVVNKSPKKKLVKVREAHNCNFSASKKGSLLGYITLVKVLPFLCVLPTLTIALWAILPLQSCTVPLSAV